MSAWRLPRTGPRARERLRAASDDWVVAALEAHGNSQAASAAAIGVSPNSLRWEMRRRGIPARPDYRRCLLDTVPASELRRVYELNHRNVRPVAELYGVPARKMWEILRRRGITSPGRQDAGVRKANWSAETLRRMRWTENLSTREIAAHYDVTRNAVQKQMVRLGVPRGRPIAPPMARSPNGKFVGRADRQTKIESRSA